MDYDGDGELDFISGSYDPGDVYLFRGLGGGEFEAVRKILDETGTPLVHHPEQLKEYERLKDDPDADDDEEIQARIASFGSWASPVDWDDDGDLDVLIGSFSGRLFRRMNEGSRTKPVYGTESIVVEAGGAPLQVSGHADPVPADWDGDGLWDLVVGASDGSVAWYRNEGTRTAPRLGERRVLVEAKAKEKFLAQYLEPGEAPKPGVRAQIAVVDYDGDGRLDLVVGDYSQVIRLRALDEDERSDFDELLRAEAEVSERLMQAYEREADTAAVEKELEAIAEEKRPYYERGETGEDSRSFVWFYRRTGVDASELEEASTRTSAADESDGKKGPVSVSAGARLAGDGGSVTLTVTLEIAPGWHVYAAVPAGSPYPATGIDLTLPEGVTALGDWRRPPGTPSANDGSTRIYEGTTTFERDLALSRGGGESSIVVDVAYQACTEAYCLPPATGSVTVVVSSSRE